MKIRGGTWLAALPAMGMIDLDAGWEMDAADSADRVSDLQAANANSTNAQTAQATSHLALDEQTHPNAREVTAIRGRSDDKRPLPGLPPEPNVRVVLAARVLQRATPGSEVARLATMVVKCSPPHPVETIRAPRSSRALPKPVGIHVALASRHRHGAIQHVGAARKPSHAKLVAVIERPRRMGTPAPVESQTEITNRKSFWQRLFIAGRRR